mgnify:FL=1
MIDLTSFTETTDQRFIESTRAGGIKNPLVAKLGNRREPTAANTTGRISNMRNFVPFNNMGGELEFVDAFSQPGLGFRAVWDDGAAFAFLRWQFGPADWIG